MYSHYDWLRRSRNGAELLAALQLLEKRPEVFDPQDLGMPFSALHGPCTRCWVYARTAENGSYCVACQAILEEARRIHPFVPYAVLVWGFVNKLPQVIRETHTVEGRILGAYIHDARHFLLALYHRELQAWLQDLAIYHGFDLKGLLQIMPATGGKDTHMGEVLVQMAHNEARFPADRLRARFFAAPHFVFHPGTLEREGVLTFNADEFLRMLDLAVVFRSVLPPHEQKILYKLLQMEDTSEAQFYWGRFWGVLTQEAKDMLNAWRIRTWSKPQIELLYELVEYVRFYQDY